MILTFVLAAVLLSAIMAVAWALAQRTGNSGWVDVVWSFGLGIAGVFVALVPWGDGPSGRQITVAVLVAAWSMRLGLHIAQRSMSGPEDARYAALRQEWGPDFGRRLFWFLQIQAAAAALLSLSILLAAHNPAPFPGLFDALGILVMLGAVAGEGLADEQLRRFKANPANKGRVCDTGLWGWSRHPNYFFEWLGWIGYFLIAIAGFWPWGWLALSGPAFMYVLLVYVSGIPMTEKLMLKSRGEVFARYQARVSPFFPLPPKDASK
jgi:steroid 5-alpha reductase family enzyme